MDEWGTVFDRAIDDEWSCEHNVDSCTTEINTRVEPLPSQFQAGYANDTDPLLAHLLGYADNIEPLPSELLGYTDNIGHVDMMQPTASASTVATKDTDMASGGVRNDNNDRSQHSQSTPSEIEVRMESNILFAEDLISKWENEGRLRKVIVWPIQIKWMICRQIEYYYKDPLSTLKKMMDDVYDELLNHSVVKEYLQRRSKNAFIQCIKTMIGDYYFVRRDLGDPDRDGYDRESAVRKCGYFFHIHKALSYSKRYIKRNEETDLMPRPSAVDDGSSDPTLKSGNSE